MPQHEGCNIGVSPYRRSPDSEDASGLSDSPTVKPARMAAQGSTAAQEPAGTSAGIFVEGPLPAGFHHLQCGPPCMPSRDPGDLC